MIRSSLALILIVAVIGSGQALQDGNFKVSVDVELVQLPVSVVDKTGMPIRGLRPQHFTVYEDKVQQVISLFKEEDIPMSVAVLIDRSGSMQDKLDRVYAAAMTFIRENNDDDETALVSFGDHVTIDQDLTADNDRLSRALSRIQANGDTALYDAILVASEYLEREATRDKKVLLVISDGEDNKSANGLRQVLKVMKESKIIVYTIGLVRSRIGDYLVYGDGGRKPLQELAQVTGGAAFFPKNIDDVQAICTKISRDLRSQYTIGYRPSNRNLDGAYRKIQVRLDPPRNTPKFQVRAKQGYYAPSDIRRSENAAKRLN
jgi:Ca-activated chloride channel homolog